MTKNVRSRALKTVRRRLHDRDDRLGAYPTILRTGDADRMGNAPVRFDDRMTIVFKSGSSVNVQYPTGMLQRDPAYFLNNEVLRAVDEDASDAEEGGGIVTTGSGSIMKGVGDVIIEDLPGTALSENREFSEEPISPFIEDGLYAVESASFDDPFYQTGSSPSDVGLGFSQPVWSKTKIEIPITPTKSTTFGYTEKPLSSNGFRPPFYPMVYYNFEDQCWEKLGTGSVAAGFNNDTPDAERAKWLEQSMLGFMRGTDLMRTASNMAALPTSNFGFPVHPKFHATSSQELSMSQHISHPFLLEKYVIECDVSYSLGGNLSNPFDEIRIFDGASLRGTDYHASINTFFLLNQRHNDSASLEHTTKFFSNMDADTATSDEFETFITTSLPTDVVLSEGGASTFVDTTRDLITFGQVLSYVDDEEGNDSPPESLDKLVKDGFSRELNIDLQDEKQSLAASARKSDFDRRVIVMSGSVKQALRIEASYGYRMNTHEGVAESVVTTGSYIPGGRTGIELRQTGRELNAAQPGGTLDFGNQALDITVLTNIGTAGDPVVNSPYLLLPSDRLVVGWQVASLFDSAFILSGSTSSHQEQGPQLIMFPGKGKLVLYGSMLRDGNEFHDTVNQNLTSPALHEMVVGDLMLDQFDTEPFKQFSGSFVDDFVTGTMGQDLSDLSATRKVMGSNVTSGSLVFGDSRKSIRLTPEHTQRQFFRGYQCISEKERYLDTLLPSISEIWKTDEKLMPFIAAIEFDTGEPAAIPYMGRSDGFYDDALVNSTWPWAYPFEPRYSKIKRRLDATDAVIVEVDSASPPNVISPFRAKAISPFRIMDLEAGKSAEFLFDFDVDANKFISPRDVDVKKVLFGFGDYTSGTISRGITNATDFLSATLDDAQLGPTNAVVGAVIRGWKYGIRNGLPEFSKAIWRRDSYGQFRDMLEQRQDSFFYIQNDQIPGRSLRAGGARVPGEQQLISAPVVRVKFVDKDGLPKDPYDTVSSNVSNAMTSSLPYFDDIFNDAGIQVGRNRELDFDEGLLGTSLLPT